MILPRWLRWRSERELEEEIRSHLDAETQDNLDRGMSGEEARYAALRKIGNTTRLRERAREADPLASLENIAQDVRYAVRSLRRNPGFTAAAVVSLALAIGANTATFSFSDGFLLRPLDVPHPANLVRVQATTPQGDDLLSYLEYTAFRDQNRTLSGLLAEKPQYFSEQDEENPQARFLFGKTVSGNYFQVLDVNPVLGRSFLAQEDSPASNIVALLSYQGWQAKFHGNPQIAGSSIRLNGQPVTIIGVLPRSFGGTQKLVDAEIYVPLAAIPKLYPLGQPLSDPQVRSLQLLGRLRAGVPVSAAQAEFRDLAERVQQAYAQKDRWRSAILMPEVTSRIREDGGQNARLVLVLLGVAAVVLLIASMNVANLLLGRASARVKEIGIRQSVGAGRGRLIAQLFTESLVLAALGTGVGLMFAGWTVAFMGKLQLPFDFPFSLPIRIDAAFSSTLCAPC